MTKKSKKKGQKTSTVKKEETGSSLSDILRAHRAVLIPAAILCAAFLMRYIFFIQMSDTPYFIVSGEGVDQNSFLEWGKEIAAGNWAGTEVFNFAPLYAYVLGMFFSVFGAKLTLVIFLQLFAGTATVYFIYLITNYLYDRPAAVIAGILSAFYGPFLFYETQFLSETVSILLFMAGYFLLIKNESRDVLKSFIFSGLLFGFSILGRPHFLIPAGFIILYYAYRCYNKMFSLRRLAAFVLALGAVLGISLVRNIIVADDPVLITAHGGINVYIGNNRNATGSLTLTEDISPSQKGTVIYAKKEAERITGRTMKASEVSNFWMKKGFMEIIRHPFHFVKLSVKKVALFFSSYEIPINISYEVFQERFSILKYGSFGFWLISPLAITGLIIAFRKRSLHGTVWFYFAGYLAVMLLFYVTSRYRLPAIPFLIIIGAAGLRQLYIEYKNKNYKELGIGAGIFFAAGMIVNLGIQTPVRSNTLAIAYYNLGNSAMNRGMIEKGIGFYQKARELNPDWVYVNKNLSSAYNDLGVHYFDTNDFGNAIVYYKKAIEIYPRAEEYYYNLGNTFLKTAKNDEAIKTFLSGLKVNPNHTGILTNLGAAYSVRGLQEKNMEDFRQAKKYFQRSLELDQNQGRARRLLNQVNMVLKNYDR